MNEPNLTPPQIRGKDHAHATVRAVLSAVPIAGGAAMEIFNAIVMPPVERRRQQWMASVVSAVEQLKMADANIVETLETSEKFHSVLLHATWAAVRNHQEEKLLALQNAVLNSTQESKTSEDLQLLFVRYVDELTPTHLVVMDFFAKNEKMVAHVKAYETLLAAFYGTTKQQLDSTLFKLICDDLKARSLVRISHHLTDFPGLYEEDVITSEATSVHPRLVVTDIGRAFIAFVLTSPLGVAK